MIEVRTPPAIRKLGGALYGATLFGAVGAAIGAGAGSLFHRWQRIYEAR
jgi:hypothetical protein